MSKEPVQPKIEKAFSITNLRHAYSYQHFNLIRSQNTLKEIAALEDKFLKQYEDVFLNSLNELLLDGEYTPSKPLLYRVPKTFGSHRIMSKLTLVDSIVYQALFSRHWLGKIVDEKMGDFVYGNRVDLSNKRRVFLIDYKSLVNRFIDKQKEAIVDGYTWRLEVDVSNFYASITHEILRKTLKEYFNNHPELNAILMKQLESWFPEGKGIPQGHESSAVLANAFLYPLDLVFSKFDCKYARYNDDMVFQFRDPQEARYFADKISMLLMDYQLQTNQKTNLKQHKEPEELNNLHIASNYIYLGGEKLNRVDAEQLIETSENIEGYLERIECFESLEKHELSRLKFFLRSGGIDSERHLRQLINAFFSTSELAFYVSNYLAQYLDDDTDLFTLFFNQFVDRYDKLTSWQKYNGSALLLSAIKTIEHNHLKAVANLQSKTTEWENQFIGLVIALNGSSKTQQVFDFFQKHFNDQSYPLDLCRAIFCRGDEGDQSRRSKNLAVEPLLQKQSSKKIDNKKTDSGANWPEQKINALVDIVSNTHSLLQDLRDVHYKPKAIFTIQGDEKDGFRVACGKKLRPYIFPKQEKWAHMCFMLVRRHEEGLNPIVKHVNLIDYLIEQHEEYQFKYPPKHGRSVRSAVNELINSANKNFYKCAPEILKGKKMFESKNGFIYLLVEDESVV